MDILEILQWMRIFKFVSTVSVRKNQAQLVKYAKTFTLDQDQVEGVQDYLSSKNVELADLMENFDPESNEVDASLLFLITGKRVGHETNSWFKACDDGGLVDNNDHSS